MSIYFFFFFSSRRRHTRCSRDWSSDVCSSDLNNYVHATPVISGGIVYLAGCDEVFRGIRIADGKEVLEFSSGGYTGASPALLGQWVDYGTFNNEVLGVELHRKRIVWGYEHS